MIVLVICRDLVTWPAAMVDTLQAWGHSPIILDNASSYPPCLRWLAHDCPCPVVRVGRNLGHTGPWTGGYVEQYADSDHYAVTDPDLDLADVTADALEVCRWHLERNPALCKVGLSLRLDDLPGDNPQRQAILDWEGQFWPAPVDGLHRAPLDTTLAVYDRRRPFTPGQIWPAGRLASPCSARHLPWYLAPHRLTDEFRYYLDHVQTRTDWARRIAAVEEAVSTPAP